MKADLSGLLKLICIALLLPATAAQFAFGEGVVNPKVKMQTTLGDIVLELNGEKAPISVSNFIQYAEGGYYNGTVFHRVISDFMIQGGGYTAELIEKNDGKLPPIKNEWQNGLKNARGTIALARLPRRADSATSEFFINVVDNAVLDQPRDGAGYAVFGRVVEGMDVVDKIRDTEVIKHPNYPGPDPVTPKVAVVIRNVEVLDAIDRPRLDQLADDAKNPLRGLIAKLEKEHNSKVIRTDSGLMYLPVREGDGPNPQPTNRVRVHYEGVFVNGEKFDSSYDRGEPAEFPLNGVIKGWTEGVGLMKPGGKAILICPPDLAYGAGRPGIPPNSTLVFTVELLEIK